MSVSALPSDPPPLRQRAIGDVHFSAAALGGRSRVARIRESGSLRIRLPKRSGTSLDAVLVNTAGGIACGDHFTVAIEAQAAAVVNVATPAAEKVYRSDGTVATLDVSLTLGCGARVDWLPQETILFNRAKLSRGLAVAMHGSARLTLFESLVFGRAASGEEMLDGCLTDRWRIRREGRLVFADTLRLEGAIAALLRKPSVTNGCRAIATFLHLAPDAEQRIEQARELLSGDGDCEAAASAWNGMLAIRFCAPSIAALRRRAVPFLIAFRGEPLPRVWHS